MKKKLNICRGCHKKFDVLGAFQLCDRCSKNPKIKEKEVKRLCKNFDKIEHRFAEIDEAIDRSLQVSQKTLDKKIDI